MSKSQITIAFDGERLRTGKMDVRELAPALLAFGELMDETNRILNGDHAEVCVNVKAEIRAGSFPVDLEVIQTLSRVGQGLLAGVKSASELVEVVAAGHKGLIWLRRKLAGKKIKSSTTITSGRVRLEIEGDEEEELDVSVDVAMVYNDARARESLRAVLRPLEKPGIDSFQVKRGRRVLEEIKKSEALLSPLDEQEQPEEVITEGTRVAALEIVKPALKGRYSWMFSDGSNTFQAEVEDENFLRAIDQREIQFGSGDVLKVDLFSKTWRDAEGLHTSYIATRVLEIIKAPQQIRLDMERLTLPTPEKSEDQR